MDENGVIIASTNPTRRGTLHSGAARIIQEGLPFLTIWENDQQAGVQNGINLPITLEGAVVGVIGITGPPEEVSVFGDILKRMTEIMVESAYQREQADLLDQARSMFVENWFFLDNPDWAELEVRGRLLGIDINSPYRVALLRWVSTGTIGYGSPEDLGEIRSGKILGMIRSQLKGEQGGYCALLRNQIIILLCQSSPASAQAHIGRICQEIESFYQLSASAGISDVSRGMSDIRRCYLEAQTAGAVAAQSSKNRVVFYDQVSLEFIVRSIPSAVRRDLEKMVFSSCVPEEKSDFVDTIRLYFQEDGDLARCARRSFVHRNTIQYRIDRIRNKTGYDLRRPQDSFILYLAVQDEA